MSFVWKSLWMPIEEYSNLCRAYKDLGDVTAEFS